LGSLYPSAIIVANNDLTDNVRNMLVKQLFIDEILDGYTFDSRVDGYDGYDGYESYIQNIKRNNKRILVIRSYQDNFDRNLTDVNIFVKLGMAHVLHNKIGPHSITYRIVNLTWDKLCIYGDTRSIL
jgi:hypothetical protein